MEQSVFQGIDRFVESTRPALFVRRPDSLLMIRPDKTMKLNRSAVDILAELYDPQSPPADVVLSRLADLWSVSRERLLADTQALLEAVGAILNEDFSPRPALRFSKFDRQMVAYPTLSEIALTYGCQNRCSFCYAASPDRHGEHRLMSSAEVERVMEKIFHQAHVPSLSFTGGESTLRPDLARLITYGKGLGLRINLISNGIRLADRPYAESLVQAGLDSAQISLEAADPEIHDSIVGRPGAHGNTVAGVKNMLQAGIHVHTNTTLCGQNLEHAPELIRFVGEELGLRTLSMNMVIRTGLALDGKPVGLEYAQVGQSIPALLDVAAEANVRLVWYSPIPYCLFNPVVHGLGAKSCACIDGILSVDPSGQVLPCSSFAQGLGSLLEQAFSDIYNSPASRYWREKKFVPPVCRSCPDVDVCAGACPLYWDAAGSFAELPCPGADDRQVRRKWELERKRGQSFGVAPPVREDGPWAP